jgi:hypothetical protein
LAGSRILKQPLKRPKSLLQTLFKLDVKPAPEHCWEGRLVGSNGSAKGGSLIVRAAIGIHGGVVAGEGAVPGRDPEIAFSLTGSVSGPSIDLALWFDTPELRRGAFSCTGAIDDERREMRGLWSCGCFDPETCGCTGGDGHFHLWRVD